MNGKIRKLFALLLCLALVIQYAVSFNAFSVYAEGEESQPVVETPAETETEPAPAPEPKPEPKLESKAEPEPEPEPEVKPELASSAATESNEEDEPVVNDSEDSSSDYEDGGSDYEEPEDADKTEGEDDDAALDEGDAEGGAAAEEPAEGVEEVPEVIEEEPEEDEEGYPEVTLSSTVNGVTVTLHAPKGALPEGAGLRVTSVTRQDVFEAVAERIAEEGREMTDAIAFDVTPLDKDGNEIQPKKSVTVTFNGTGLEAGDGGIDVFRVSDNAASVTEMSTSIATAGKQQFSTDHFTIYVSTGSLQDPNGDETNTANSSGHRLEIEFGKSVTLVSNNSGLLIDYYELQSGSGVSVTNTTYQGKSAARVTNNNTGSNELRATIRHHYGLRTEDYYVIAKPQVLTVTFMLQDAGENEPRQYLDTKEVVKGRSVDPYEMEPSKEVDGKTYTFYGWCTDTGFQTDATFTNITTDLTVYGKYTTDAKIIYKKNTSDPATVPEDQSGGAGNKVRLGGATRAGFALRAWNTKSDGTGTPYSEGQSVTMPEDGLVLYAQWSEDEMVMRYQYNYPFSGGTFESVSHINKNSRTTLITDIPTRPGNYVFRGWAKDDDANNPQYYPGDTYTTGSSNEEYLYAVWGNMSYDDLTPLTANSKEVMYDGEEKDVSGVTGGTPWERDSNYVKVGDTAIFGIDIYAFVGNIKASGTDAGYYATPVTAPLYYLTFGNMVRIDFLLIHFPHMEIGGGGLKIKPAEVTVETESLEKPYDGTPLTAGGKAILPDGSESEFPHEGGAVTLYKGKTLNMRTTGEQTDPGESDNPFEVDWGKPDDWGNIGLSASTAMKYNYKITPGKEGALTVYNEYTVEFKDEGGTVILPAKSYKENTPAEDITVPDDPTKPEDETNTYEFEKWNPDLAPVTGDATYTASYTTHPIYTLSFDADAGDEEVTVPGDKKAKFSKVADDSYKVELPADKPSREHYSFLSWSPEQGATEADPDYAAGATITLDSDKTLYAVWKIDTFKVEFVDEDGTTVLLAEKEYPYGTAASDIEKPADPEKESDGQYTYTFDGWEPDIEDVTEDVVYKAKYTASAIPAQTDTDDGDDDDDDDDDGGDVPARTDTDDDDDDDGDAPAAAAAAGAIGGDNADEIIEDTTEPTDEPAPTETIDDEPAPQAPPEGTWALLDVIAGLLTAAAAVAALVRRKDEEGDEEGSAKTNANIAKAAAAVLAVAAAAAILMTQDFGGAMQYTDKWTALMAVLFAGGAAADVMTRRFTK